jgi:hypothetical protein
MAKTLLCRHSQDGLSVLAACKVAACATLLLRTGTIALPPANVAFRTTLACYNWGCFAGHLLLCFCK